MSNGPTADAVLVAGVIDGDEAALESIYRKYGGAVKLLASKVSRDDSPAEEVVRDVFVTFWGSAGDNRGRFPGPGRGGVRPSPDRARDISTEGISAGVLGNEPALAAFTWTGEVTGFAL
ncbi:MAG: hypothetical protein ACLFRT_04900 [Actinomycetota bacterium]